MSLVSIQRSHRTMVFLLVLLFATFLTNTLLLAHSDEADNLIGGRQLNQHGKLYADYWSHHMPGAYVVSAALTGIGGHHYALVRLFWVLLLCVFWVTLLWIMRSSDFAPYVYLLGLTWAMIGSSFWGHLLLAETITAYLLVAVYLLLLFKVPHEPSFTLAVFIALALGFVVYSALVFVYAALVLGLWTVWLYRHYRLRLLIAMGISTLTHVVVSSFTLDISKMIYQTYTFNVKYFSGNSYHAESPLEVLIGYLWVFTQIIHAPPIWLFLFSINIIVVALYIRDKQYAIAIASGLLCVFTYYPFHAVYELGSHLSTHAFISVANGSIIIYKLMPALNNQLQKRPRLRLLGPIMLGVIVLYVASILILSFALVVTSDIQTFPQQSCYADFFNSFLEEDETYWIGPFNFFDIQAIEHPLASRHSFYIPWIANDPRNVSEIMDDWEENKPVIIVLEPQWRDHITADFAAPLVAWLDDNYFSLEAYPHYYLYAPDHQEIVQRLETSTVQPKVRVQESPIRCQSLPHHN